MADDIFLTPEEQDERARQWLKENGPALAIGIALGLGAIFGWNYYKDQQLKSAEQASALYAAALEEIQSSSLSDIDAQVKKLQEEHAKSSYAAKAALLKAKQLSVSDLPAAYEQLQWVVDNASEAGLQHTARLRQAKIKLSMGELDAASSLAAHQPTEGFESHYAEIQGDIAIKNGDTQAARAHYQASLDNLTEGQSSYAQLLTIKLNRLPEEVSVAPGDDVANGDVSTDAEVSEQPSEQTL